MNLIFQRNNFKSTLDITSIDKDSKASLIQDKTIKVYHFDGITKYVAKKLRNGKVPRSCDAFYLCNNGDGVLIEFKNRIHDVISKEEIFEKAYDSILPLLATFYVNNNMEELTTRLTYIVVYNDNKKECPEKTVSKSKAWQDFGMVLGKLSGITKSEIDTVYFDLRDLKGELFKEVYTIDKEIFIKEFMYKLIV